MLCSTAATVGTLASIETYSTGRPKLKPLIRLSVTVPA